MTEMKNRGMIRSNDRDLDTCPYRKSNSDIMVVQSTQDRQAENAAKRDFMGTPVTL
jgi:hypothetical protein